VCQVGYYQELSVRIFNTICTAVFLYSLMATCDWIHEVRTSFNFLYDPVTLIKITRQWLQQAVGYTRYFYL